MGGGIAWALSNADLPVTLKDVAPEPLKRGVAAATGMYRQLVERGRLADTAAAAKQRLITATTDYGPGFADVDLAVEAVSEDLPLKIRVLAELEEQVRPHTLIASNTSSLPIEELASALQRPERFLALHFFNPVNRMRLVEIAAAPTTDRRALAGAVELARSLGKTPVVVRGRPGFLVNRILFPYLMEAVRVLEDGGDWLALERELTAWGMPMGPFRLIDEIGLDVTVNIARSLASSYDQADGAAPHPAAAARARRRRGAREERAAASTATTAVPRPRIPSW